MARAPISSPVSEKATSVRCYRWECTRTTEPRIDGEIFLSIYFHYSWILYEVIKIDKQNI